MIRPRLLQIAALACAGGVVAQDAPRLEATLEFSRPNRSDAVPEMIARMTERAEISRAFDLTSANQNSITTLLDLTRFSPIALGASDSRVDTFFLQNGLRADLNPRRADPLSLGQ